MLRLSVLIGLLAFTCNNFITGPGDVEFTGSVQGTVINSLIDQPVADVTVYLLDRTVEIDTVDYQNRQVFVDSALTDENGNYLMVNVMPGSYAVLPAVPHRTFQHDTTSDPFQFELEAGDVQTVDFKEIIAVQAAAFQSTIRLVNVPEDLNDSIQSVTVWRRWWALFVPFFAEPTPLSHGYSADDNAITSTWVSPYGYTALLATLDDCFRVDYVFKPNTYSNFSVIVYTQLLETPPYVYWKYDWETKTLCRANGFWECQN